MVVISAENALQIHEEARKFSYQSGVKVVVAYGGAPINHQVSFVKYWFLGFRCLYICWLLPLNVVLVFIFGLRTKYIYSFFYSLKTGVTFSLSLSLFLSRSFFLFFNIFVVELKIMRQVMGGGRIVLSSTF